jgi:hypothetical protein
MNEIPDITIRALPRAYREKTRIIEETRFSIWFLRIVASLSGPTDEIIPRGVIEQRAHGFSTEWEERELGGLFAIDCPEVRGALAELDGLMTSHSSLAIDSKISGPPINLVHAVEPVLRGNLEVIETLRMTAVARSPHLMLFIRVLDDRNKIDRDNHHVGWHYHYCKPSQTKRPLVRAAFCFSYGSRTPRRAATRIALHARSIPHQREVEAFAAHLAFVSLGFRFQAAFGLGGGGLGGGACLAPLHRFQLFGR